MRDYESRAENERTQARFSPQPLGLSVRADLTAHDFIPFSAIRDGGHVHVSLFRRSLMSGASGRTPIMQLQRSYGNRYVRRLLSLAQHEESGGADTSQVEAPIEKAHGGELTQEMVRRQVAEMPYSGGIQRIFRQTAASPGMPGGPDPCADLLEQLFALLNDVAERIREALDDQHHLFDFRPGPNPEEPQAGTWDGHREKFYYQRERLRHKVAEWESNDQCRGYALNPQEQEDLQEAYDYKEREFPDRPAPTMRQAPSEQPQQPSTTTSNWDTVLEVVIALGLSVALVATIVAALADPEPASKLALAGLSWEEIQALGTALGFATAVSD